MATSKPPPVPRSLPRIRPLWSSAVGPDSTPSMRAVDELVCLISNPSRPFLHMFLLSLTRSLPAQNLVQSHRWDLTTLVVRWWSAGHPRLTAPWTAHAINASPPQTFFVQAILVGKHLSWLFTATVMRVKEVHDEDGFEPGRMCVILDVMHSVLVVLLSFPIVFPPFRCCRSPEPHWQDSLVARVDSA